MIGLRHMFPRQTIQYMHRTAAHLAFAAGKTSMANKVTLALEAKAAGSMASAAWLDEYKRTHPKQSLGDRLKRIIGIVSPIAGAITGLVKYHKAAAIAPLIASTRQGTSTTSRVANLGLWGNLFSSLFQGYVVSGQAYHPPGVFATTSQAQSRRNNFSNDMFFWAG